MGGMPTGQSAKKDRNKRISYVTNDKEATRRAMFGLRPYNGQSVSYKSSIPANKFDDIGRSLRS